jgi:glucan 1,3-beta-glucosidase
MAQYNPYAPVHDPNRAPEHIEMSAQPIHSSPYASPYHHAGEIPLSHSPALPNIEDLPPGAAATVPRFYGSARYDDPVPRQSIAESIGGTSSGPYDPNRPFDNNSSHALNPYHDDPHGGAAPVHGYRDDPNGPSHYYDSSADTSNAMLGEKKGYYDTYQNEKKPRRKGLLVGGIIVGLLLLAAAVVVPIYFFVIRKNSDSTDGGNSSDPSSTNGPSAPTATLAALTGGDGSEVTLEGGAKFTYVNKFGGHWVYDPNNPFNNSARPQSWSPPLNQPFQYGVDKIRG